LRLLESCSRLQRLALPTSSVVFGKGTKVDLLLAQRKGKRSGRQLEVPDIPVRLTVPINSPYIVSVCILEWVISRTYCSSDQVQLDIVHKRLLAKLVLLDEHIGQSMRFWNWWMGCWFADSLDRSRTSCCEGYICTLLKA
jgi:hypothetical protein